MYRAPEMVDLYSSPLLTRSTDSWALGCCLYTMLFFRNTFEEGSNLAILSGKYAYPPSHPYGPCLPTLIDRCLEVDPLARLTVPEIIQNLQSCMSNNSLPPLPRQAKPSARPTDVVREGSFRVDGQGVGREKVVVSVSQARRQLR